VKYKTSVQKLAFGDQILDRIKSFPGVEAAGSVTFLPLSGWHGHRKVGLEHDPDSSQGIATWSSVTPDYFRAMSIPLVSGRFFSNADRSGAPPVAIVSRSLAKRLSPDSDAVGQRIRVEGLEGVLEIAGIVGDVRQLGLSSELTPEVYLPFNQAPAPFLCFAIKTRLKPASLAKPIQREIWAVDKDQSIGFVMPLDDLAADSVAPQRIVAALLVFFAVVALLMAAMGTYGVISYSASQRTQEIGIRMALGARRIDVLAMTIVEGMRLAGLGLVLGLVVALAFAHFLSAILYGVEATDPFTFILVSLLLAAVALAACYIPARRASKLNPMSALRYE